MQTATKQKNSQREKENERKKVTPFDCLDDAVINFMKLGGIGKMSGESERE
jgi:hypothetical protein